MATFEWDGLFQCEFCKKRFEREALARQIFLGHNCKPQRLDICPECEKKYETKILIIETAVSVLELEQKAVARTEKMITSFVQPSIESEESEE